jgi:hypothetical protein
MVNERNPYAPPAAEVGGPAAAEVGGPTSTAQPPQVSVALKFLSIGMFIGIVVNIGLNGPSAPLVRAIDFLVLSCIATLCLYGLHQRQRWLWWLTVIVVALGLILALIVARVGTGRLPTAYYYVQCAFLAPAIVLLCSAPARKWFFHARATP